MKGSARTVQVVVGLHPGRGRIAVLDPAAGLRCNSLSRFESLWRPARGVSLVVFLPEAESFLTMGDGKKAGGGS